MTSSNHSPITPMQAGLPQSKPTISKTASLLSPKTQANSHSTPHPLASSSSPFSAHNPATAPSQETPQPRLQIRSISPQKVIHISATATKSPSVSSESPMPTHPNASYTQRPTHPPDKPSSPQLTALNAHNPDQGARIVYSSIYKRRISPRLARVVI